MHFVSTAWLFARCGAHFWKALQISESSSLLSCVLLALRVFWAIKRLLSNTWSVGRAKILAERKQDLSLPKNAYHGGHDIDEELCDPFERLHIISSITSQDSASAPSESFPNGMPDVFLDPIFARKALTSLTRRLTQFKPLVKCITW